jgi:DNA-binding transcriptional LysR family regulator
MRLDQELGHGACLCALPIASSVRDASQWRHAGLGMTSMTGLDVGGLTLDDLKALSVLLDQRSVTRAAEILGTTQPSLSKVLARLRHHFKDPLLLRDGHTMTPTRLADHLLEPLRSVLASTGALGARDVRFDARTSARVFRLVVTDVGMVRFLPPLICSH